MTKQINVKLGFEADTSKAKSQIADLQKSLDNLLSGSVKEGALRGFDTDIAKAQQSILKLKTVLDNSLNMNTGHLDLSKFNTQLNNSGLTLSQLSAQMGSMGTSGQKAFLNLANSIVTAQKPMVETNKLLDGMWTALKNTARWQLSSSLLHGFIGAIQGAYGYAQDLNRSLNDIAIVTGRSTDQMAEFAEQANKSAQALSVSTTAYTDAALIYYQQGLDDAEVKARTDVTMKLSNVTGQSAEEVSSYMTAIWNNFDDGSKSLEYYADVITALGAATASSSREIANGMQQFAAVAETVGLSYEYAATALATVVAQTRQSESTVGNSFRTIFSRMQGLKLGETLEDGTDLNKYSKALLSIGVSIKDQNGELKEMDTILDEVGEKWQTLSKDQQVALAQTVGGVRQYTNLIALFDNWDKFQKNLSIAEGAEGSLEGQADIYAQSWEAAQKRVKAAWQAIYQDLISDKFFITLLNGFEKVLQGLDKFIDGIGGLKGVLSGLGIIITTVFEKQLISALQNAQQQMKNILKINGQSYAKIESDAVSAATMQASDDMIARREVSTDYEKAEVDVLKTRLDLNGQFKQQYDDLNNSQRQYAEGLLGVHKQWEDIYLKALKTKEETTQAAAAAKDVLKNKIIDYQTSHTKGTGPGKAAQFRDIINGVDAEKVSWKGKFEGFQIGEQKFSNINNAIQEMVSNEKIAEEGIESLTIELTKQGKSLDITAEEARNYINGLYNQAKAEKAAEEQLKNYGASLKSTQEGLNNLKNIQTTYGMSSQDILTLIAKRITSINNQANAEGQLTEELEKERNKLIELYKEYERVEQSRTNSPKYAEGIVTAARGISQISMAINSFATAFNALKDNDKSIFDKLMAVVPAITMAIPALIGGITALGKSFIELGWAQELAAGQSMTFWTAITGPVGWVIAGIAAITATIWVLDKAFYTTSERLADANKELAESKEALAEVEEQADKASQAYENLVDVLDGLKDKRDNINQLVEGTTEWKEAIADSNAELLNALELSGQLKDAKYSYGKGGLISLENGDELKEASRLNSLTANMAATFAKVEVKNNEKDVALAEALNTVQKTYTTVPEDRGKHGFDAREYSQGLGKDEDVLQNLDKWTQAVIDAGLAGKTLNTDNIDQLIEAAGGQLDVLNEIKDRNDVLQAIQSAADQIAGADKESDAYKKEVGRMAAEAAGYDTSGMSGEALENFYLSLYSDLKGKVDEEWDKLSEDKQLASFAEGNDKYKWDGEHLIDVATSEIVKKSDIAQSEIELYGKSALLEQKAVSTEAIKSMENFQKEAIEQQKNDLISKASNNFSDNNMVSQAAISGFSSEQLDIGLNADMSQFKSVWEFIDYVKEACKEHHELNVNVNTEDLTQFKGKLEDLKAEHAALSKFIQDNWDDYKDLSEHLGECDAAADALAWSMMRFDDAMQDVSKNYKDWKKALDSKDVVQMNKAVQSLKKTYGNLLDMDGSKLSDDFLKASENLDSMNTVLNGTEEEAIAAYEALSKAAAIDIAENKAIELGVTFDETAFNTMYETISNEIDRLHLKAGDPIPIGSPDYSALVSGLNGMLALVGNDVTAAKNLFAQLGFQAEFENVPAESEDEQSNTPTSVNWTPSDSPPFNGVRAQEGEGLLFESAPGPSARAWELNYEEGTPVVTKNKKTTNVGGLKIKDGSLHYIGGGSPKIKNSPARNIGSGGKSGGGCFAAGTLITLQGYSKNIEDIQVGDIVLSYNEKTKKNVFNKVLQRMVHIVKEKIYSLFIKDEELTVTGIHRFLITRNNKQKWIQASELQKGDLVLLADGTLQEISNINIEEKPLTVYNFEVSNTHNYYVGENQVLVHNKGKKGGGGKGSSKKAKVEKPKEKKKNIKEEDRYHNIKEKIDDLNKSMDRLNKNKDRAYGKDRIKYMQAEIDKTKEQIGLTKDYIKEINKYRKIDRANLDKVLGKGWKDLNTGKLVGGLNLKNPDDLFDADGILKNYEELFNTIQDRFDQTATKTYNKAVDEYNAAVAKFNKDQNQDAFDKAKEKLEAAEEEYKNQEDIYKQQIDYLKQYEETMNLWQEKQQERIDQMNELLDKELELTRHKIELRLEVADDEKSKLEWLYDNLGDSADRAADRIANLGQQARVAHKNIDTYLHALTNELEDIKDWEGYTKAGTKVSLKNLIESGELDYDINDPDSILNAFQKINNYITQDWIGAELPMQEILDDFAKYRDGLMDEYSTLREIADTVEEQLISAFEEWNEKLDDNLSLFDHYDTVIDTYKEIADLLGPDALGFDPDVDMSYQRAKLSNQQQAARFAKDAYDEAINERIKAQERLANATSDIERKAAEEYLKLCEETERERQEEFLARTRDALRQAQELFEKTLENNQKAYLKSLGGGTPNLGILQNQLDMNKELNDLYLDDYEKYKKLGDLQNNINKQLAKNPNVKVQGKLNDLLDDVNSKMAAGAEISEGEATILEKRLQLLQAEDQLMAARNAKSAVRMTRDNEGNFSYTYTADTSKIEEAQQNYADKFYDLLDYEKQYSQEVQDNILQAMQEFNDKAAEIMEDSTLSQAEKDYLLKQLEDQCKMKVKFYTDQMQIVTDEMTRFKNDDWADMEQTLGRMLASDSDFETNFNETTLGKIAPAWNEAKDAMVDFVSAADTLVGDSINAMNQLLIDNETTMNLVDSSTEAFAENYTGLLQDVVDKSVAAAEAGESLIQTMSDSLNEVLGETKAYYEEYGKELDDLFDRINKVTNVINQFRANWNGEATYEVATTDTGRAGANPSTVSMSNPSEGVNNPTDRFTSTFAGQPVITSVSGTTLPNSTPAELVGDNSEWLNSVIDKAMIKYDSLLSMNKSQTVAGNNNVVINADFPNVESYQEIAKAFETLINSASQYANENNG